MKLRFTIITLLLFVFATGTITAQDKILSARKLRKKKIYTSIEKALKNPEKVYRLHLDRKNNKDSALTEVPTTIFQLPNLQELSIANNNIESLPDELFKITNLQILILSFNPIEEISDDISKLKNLRILEMKFCKLTYLPIELSKLSNLEELDIYANHISDIPKEFALLKNLEVFIIRKNGITKAIQDRVKAMLPKTDFER